VLFPAFARLNNEPERQRRAVVRATRAIMLSGTAACLALAVVVEPVEHILWRGKWQEAVWPVVILGLFYPWRITFGLTVSVLQGQGRFKRVALLTFVEGVGLVLAALAASVLVPTPMGLALFSGVWLFVARLAITCFTLRTIGVGWGETLWSIFPAWILGCAATGATLGLDHLLGPGPRIASALGAAMPGSWADLLAEFFRAGMLGLTAAGLYGVGCRLIIADHMLDLLSVAPARLARPAAALFRLRPP
jgi:O-antigen/teichoic acid export membrane protein